MLHLARAAAGLVSHVSVIGGERPPFTLYDGQRWLRDAVPAHRVSSALTPRAAQVHGRGGQAWR